MQLKKDYLNSIKNDLKKRLSKKRYLHTMGVVEVAIKLAKKNDVNIEKTIIAALLHDYAKPLSEKELLNYAQKMNGEIDSIEIKIPAILHAPVGAFLVKQKYDIINKDILEAIRYHTIGKPDMGKLALIIFAADFIESNRSFPGVEKLRDISDNCSLAKLIVAVCDQSIEYNIAQKKIIHPNTLLLRNEHLGGK
ncbi:MAG: bis(5'-nucleosyl)-tetraphosphatase (symmetrical) YqeK [Bacillota bacterium]